MIIEDSIARKESFKEEKRRKDIIIRELLSLAIDEYERRQKEEFAHPDDSFSSAFSILEAYINNRY